MHFLEVSSVISLSSIIKFVIKAATRNGTENRQLIKNQKKSNNIIKYDNIDDNDNSNKNNENVMLRVLVQVLSLYC